MQYRAEGSRQAKADVCVILARFFCSSATVQQRHCTRCFEASSNIDTMVAAASIAAALLYGRIPLHPTMQLQQAHLQVLLPLQQTICVFQLET
jgi:hypothetical protein